MDKIVLKKNSSLHDVEQLLRSSLSETSPCSLLLPRHIGNSFFLDSRVFALIGTVARARETTVIDSYKTDQTGSDLARFTTSVEGINAIRVAKEITSNQGVRVHIGAREAQRILRRTRWLEGDDVHDGKSSTCIAWDPAIVNPKVFIESGLQSVSLKQHSWDDMIDSLRQRHFNIWRWYEHLASDKQSSHRVTDIEKFDKALKVLTFEIFENSFKHSRRDFSKERNPSLNGIRFIRIRKHIANNRDSFLSRADSFPELQHFIEHAFPKKGACKLYEIAISDSGIGIPRRFRAHDHLPKNYDLFEVSDDELINLVIRRKLSSDSVTESSGLGLDRVIKAADSLKAFISLRTGKSSLIRDPFIEKKCLEGNALASIEQSEPLCEIAGTHYNILVPY